MQPREPLRHCSQHRMGHRDAVLHIRAVAVNACRRSGRPARDLGLTAELRPGSRKRTTDRPIALSVTLQESLDGPDSLQCACAGATHNAVICVRVAASFAQRLYARNRRSARLITKYADEFGDHRDRQVLDGICRAVHKHACRQRPLFRHERKIWCIPKRVGRKGAVRAIVG